MSSFEALLREFAREVAREVARELRAGDVHDMIDQAASPLGRKRHCAAVRRRMSAGQPGASHVGRRFLLSREALEQELAAQSKRPRKAPASPAPAVDELAELRATYGLQRAS